MSAHRAVLCYIQKGLGEHQETIKAILNEVARFQWRDHYSGYPFCLFSFGWEDQELRHHDKAIRFPGRASHIKLANQLCDLTGTESVDSSDYIPQLFPPSNPYSAIRSVRNQDLALFFCKNRSVTMNPDLEKTYTQCLQKRAVWVFLENGSVEIELGESFVPEFKEQKENSNMTQPQVTIHRYSERGLVNAWVEDIRRNPDCLIPCLEQAVSVASGKNLHFDEKPCQIEIYPEYSLSQFGDPDLVLILHYPNKSSKVIFIEAKLEPFLRSSPPMGEGQGKKPITNYQKNASTVLHELFLKSMFWNHFDAVKKGISIYATELEADSDASRKNKARKIGYDKQVLSFWEAMEIIRHNRLGNVYFVALTTDTKDSLNKDQTDIEDQIIGISKINNQYHYWHELTYILPWKSLWELSQNGMLPDTKTTIEENMGKFTFPEVEEANQERLNEFWLKSSLHHGPTRIRKGKWTLYNKQGKAAATYSIVHGFRGPEAQFYLIKEKQYGAVPCANQGYIPKSDSEEFQKLINELKGE